MICAESRHADPEILGVQLAQQLLQQGAGAILSPILGPILGSDERRA
jgi:hypothetical protein